MGISAFRRLFKQITPVYSASSDIFSNDLVFDVNTEDNSTLGTPENTMREIQIQFLTNTAGFLTITFDGGLTFFLINNGDAILGLATFTIFVDKDTELNFRFSDITSLILSVGG